jgi:hypothetical protein
VAAAAVRIEAEVAVAEGLGDGVTLTTGLGLGLVEGLADPLGDGLSDGAEAVGLGLADAGAFEVDPQAVSTASTAMTTALDERVAYRRYDTGRSPPINS